MAVEPVLYKGELYPSMTAFFKEHHKSDYIKAKNVFTAFCKRKGLDVSDRSKFEEYYDIWQNSPSEAKSKRVVVRGREYASLKEFVRENKANYNSLNNFLHEHRKDGYDDNKLCEMFLDRLEAGDEYLPKAVTSIKVVVNGKEYNSITAFAKDHDILPKEIHRWLSKHRDGKLSDGELCEKYLEHKEKIKRPSNKIRDRKVPKVLSPIAKARMMLRNFRMLSLSSKRRAIEEVIPLQQAHQELSNMKGCIVRDYLEFEDLFDFLSHAYIDRNEVLYLHFVAGVDWLQAIDLALEDSIKRA